MPVDFDDIFFEDETENYNLPAELIKSMSNQLPEGFKYEQVPGEKTLVLVPTSKEGTISGVIIDFKDPVFEGFLPLSLSEALEYLYRTQKSIEMSLKDNDNIIINGEKISTSIVLNDPLKESESKVNKILMTPAKFPEIGEIILENKSIKEIFKIKRVPHANMTECKYEASNNGGFKVNFTWHEVKNNITVSFKIEPLLIVTSVDMSNALKLYKAFLTGDLKMNGQDIGSIVLNDSTLDIEAINEGINLWDKILKIEEKLNVEFKPNDISAEGFLLIKKLYRSLVENKYYKEFVSIKSFKMTNLQIDDIEEMREKLNDDNAVITISNPAHINLLGKEIDLKMITHLFDFKVKDIEVLLENKEALIIIDEEKSEHAYQCIKFLTQEDLEQANENIDDIRAAQEI